MKKIFLLISMIAVLGSCSDSFLDTQNLTKKDSGIFPVSTSDAEEVLTAMYRPIMGNANMPQSSSFLTAELMSDDRLAFDYYTHFTSPIRRYPDTIVHRLLARY